MNKGNVLYAKLDYEKAREFFKEALSNDSSCVEALYNLGKAASFLRVFLCHYLVPSLLGGLATIVLCFALPVAVTVHLDRFVL